MVTDMAKATLADGGPGILLVLLVSLLLVKIADYWKARRVLTTNRTGREAGSTTPIHTTPKRHRDEIRRTYPEGATRDKEPPPRPPKPLVTWRPLPTTDNTQGGQWAK